jgi:spore coat polysaccharide biosynthesis protein SpsF
MGKIMAFLQARMGSKRLPGKTLLRIQGKSILERAIERLQCARKIDQVVVLTTKLDEDDAVVEEARRLGVDTFRGPAADVLKRFQQAAELFRPEVVVRATADNPLIDIGSANRIVQALQSSNLDWCMECNLPVGAATEAMTARALAEVDRIAHAAGDREHVTLYIKEHQERFRVALLVPPDTLRRPALRLTVDTPEDFIFVEDIIQHLPETGRPLPLESYLEIAANLSRARMHG